jgi:hypothetical protein
MAKRRARGAPRELTRAEAKAIERRTASAAAPVVEAMPEEPASQPLPGRRGVLPPRGGRVYSTATLSRAQEMAYVRSDLRRLTILAALMVAILLVLAVVLR